MLWKWLTIFSTVMLLSFAGLGQKIVSLDLSLENMQGTEYRVQAELEHGCVGLSSSFMYQIPVQLSCSNGGLDTIHLILEDHSYTDLSICQGNTNPLFYCGCVIQPNMLFTFRTSRFEAEIDLANYPNLQGCDTLMASTLLGYFPYTINQTLFYLTNPLHVGFAQTVPSDSSYNSTPHAYGFDSPVKIGSGDEMTVSMAMIDLDGDSLVYSLSETYAIWSSPNQFDTVLFTGGNSTGSPMPGISIGSSSGLMKISPAFTDSTFWHFEGYGMSVRVEEYDRLIGNWKGRSHRNYWFGVFEDSINQNPDYLGIDSVSGATIQGGGLQATIGQPFDLFVSFADSNSQDSIEVFSNLESIASNYSIQHFGTNPVTAKISATIMQPITNGLDFIIQARDSYCPYRGFTSRSIHLSADGVLVPDDTVCAESWTEVSAIADSVNWTSVAGNNLVSGTNFNCLNAGCTSAEFQLNDTTIVAINALKDGIWYQDTFTLFTQPKPIVLVTTNGAACVSNDLWVKAVVSNVDSFDITWTDNYSLIGNIYQDSFMLNLGFPDTFTFPYEVESAFGCTTVGVHEQVIHAKPTIDAGQYSQACIGQTIQLLPSGGDYYTWSPSTYLNDTIGMPEATLYSAISYTLLGVDSFGCSNTDSVEFNPDSNFISGQVFNASNNPISDGVVRLLELSSTSNNEILIDSTHLDLDGEFIMPVADSAGFIEVIPDPTSFPNLATTYHGDVYGLGQSNPVATIYCDTTFIQIEMLKKQVNGIVEVSEVLKVFPNPTSDELRFSTSLKRCQVLSSEGSILDIKVGDFRSINVEHLKPGVYFIRAWRSGRYQTTSFVKE